jgi:hypothetical protein
MERLKNRRTGSQSRNKMVSMIELYEQYVDEPIETIRIWSSTMYLINDKWNVDISTNKVRGPMSRWGSETVYWYQVDRSYPDPDW